MKIALVVTPLASYPKKLVAVLRSNGYTVIECTHIKLGIKESPDRMIIVGQGPIFHVPFLDNLEDSNFPVLWIYNPGRDACPQGSPHIAEFISRVSTTFISDTVAFINNPPVKVKS